MSNAKSMTKRHLGILLAALLAVVALSLALAATPQAKADDGKTVTSWEELVAAINDGGTNIIVANDLRADGSIEISGDVTLRGSDSNVTIYQKKRDTYDTMFKVKNGILTLGNNLTLSGKAVDCSGGTVAAGTLNSASGPLGISGTQVGLNNPTDGIEYSVENGLLVATISGVKYYVDSEANYNYSIHTASSDKTLKVNTPGGGAVENFENGKSYILFDPLTNGYLAWDGNYLVSKIGGMPVSNSNALQFTFTKTSDIPGSDGQGCDGKSGECNKYTTTSFPSGTADAPRGFFIEVEAGGTAELVGNAKLTNFTTGPSVSNVAPVYVNGGTFDVKGSAQITGNSVGYTADNSKSTDGTAANLIKQNKDSGLLSTSWARTNTAGAIIYANGATGTITENAAITNNRADAGALVVTGGAGLADEVEATATTKVTVDGNAAIDYNAGVHFAGATHIYNGGEVMMAGGQMNNNWSWWQGGAVWVSSEVYDSAVFNVPGSATPVAEAVFTLDGGKLQYNTTTYQGGALMVESNKVALLSGELSYNNSRTLGGAIYVAGDAVDHMYRLYIKHGCITDNKAVTEGGAVKAENQRIDQGLAPNDIHNPSCDFTNQRVDGLTGGNVRTANWTSYNNYQGRGGGIWLCSIGGNATFNYDADHNVVINENTADTHGQDINLRPAWPNGGSTINVIEDETGDIVNWKNEVTGEPVQPNTIYTGSLRITNEGSAVCPRGGVSIHDNYARNGGAIAANGTVIFGKDNTVHRIAAALELTKAWGEGTTQEPVTLSLQFQVKDKSGKYVNVLDAYSVTLDGEVDIPNENTEIYESAPYVAMMGLPLTATDDQGNVIPLYTVMIDGVEQDPTTPEGLAAIYNGVDSGKAVAVGDWRIEVTESDTNEHYLFVPGDVTITNKAATNADPITYYDKTGTPVGTTTVNFVSLGFSQTVLNEIETPEIEKYVNQDVHQELASVDEVFTYDIIAYATKDATKLTITDELVKNLQYVSKAADVKVVDLGEANNHKTNGDYTGKNDDATVAQAGQAVKADVNIEGEKLTVVVDDVEAQGLRGHYVKVTVQAKIAEDADYVTVDDNGTVASDLSHTGIPNTAKYVVDTARGPYDICESNTVTVKPTIIKISKTDLGGTEIEGATIKVTGKDFEDEWVSTTEPHELILKPGDYEMVEVVAPDGYEPITTTIKFTVNKDGSVVVNNASEVDGGGNVKVTEGNHIVLADAPINDTPEIEKYVNQDVHQELTSLDEEFTYDIIAYATKDATKLTITDELVKNLQYVSKAADVKVVDLGETNNHKTNGDYTGKNADATVAQGGKAVKADVNIEDAKLTVVVDDVEKQGLRGHYVKVTVKAKIADDADYVKVEDNGTVASDLSHEGIPNTASYVVDTARGPYDKCDSNTVTVKPKEDKPEIEKYVNKNVHQDLAAIDETFTYDVIAYVTADADNLTLTDTLDNQLQFVGDAASVTVADMGETVNHNPNGSVAQDGNPLDKAAYKADVKGQTLTVTIADAKALRGHWVKVTFDAKIKDGLTVDDLKYTFIKHDAPEDRAEPNKGNDPVITDEDHTGVPNKASYTIGVGNKPNAYSDTSNTVTVKPEPTPEPEKPEIEKYVNQDVHKDVAIDEVFTYDIVAYATKDATKLTITDELVKNLEYVSTSADVKVVDLVETNNHKTNGDYTGKNDDATVAQAGQAVKADVNIEGKKLTVVVGDVEAQGLRGHYVKVTVQAKIAEDADYVTIDDNGTVLSDKSHTGIPNTAKYVVEGERGPYDECESNTVTVKPEPKPETPQIEKYVNKDVHKDIAIDEVFPYDVIVYVPTDADTIQIRDTLVDQLTFVDGADDIAATAVVKAANDHTVNGTVASGDGAAIAATGKIEGQTLTVDVADATAARGKYIQITFDAKIKDGYTAESVAEFFATITDNGDVLGGADTHTGVPNTAEYRIGIKNGAEVDYAKYAPEGNPEGWNESNTVTVKPEPAPEPETFPVVISKTDITDGTGAELPGAEIKIVDADGNVVDEWTSTDKPRELNLKPGTYTMEEVNAPEGFDKITTTITFVVDEKGNVTLTGAYEDINGKIEVKDLNHLVLSDMPTKTPGPDKFPVVISKQDITSSTELPGAEIKITDEQGKVIEWTSTDKPRELQLAPGKYTMEEVNAPKGYQSITTVITFVVDEKGNVTLEGAYEDINGAIAVQDVNHLVLSDKPEKYLKADAAVIKKAWFDGKNGAGNTEVSFTAQYSFDGENWINSPYTTTVKGEAMDEDGLWVASFTLLPAQVDGRDVQWRAVETPVDGYIAATSTVTDAAAGMYAKNLVDDGTPTPKGGVTISKQAVGGGKELPGATLIIRDADGNEIERWVSGTTPYRTTLPAGEYTLTEITAPDGYEVAETMRFRVNEDGTVEVYQDGKWVDATDHVVMFDAPKPKDGDDDKKVNPPRSDTPKTPTTPAKSTVVRGTTVKTGDALGMLAVGALVVALAGAGGIVLARRRMTK